MSKPNLANKKECTGCLACVSSCNKNALSSYIDEEGHLAVRCNTEKCVLCHKCEQVCPVISDFDTKEIPNQNSMQPGIQIILFENEVPPVELLQQWHYMS